MRNKMNNTFVSYNFERTRCGTLFGIMTFLTVISQLPQFVRLEYSSPIARVIWVIGLLWLLFNHYAFYINNRIRPAISMAVVLFLFSFLQLLLLKSNLLSSLASSILLSVFVLFIATLTRDVITKHDLNFIAKCFIFASVILAIDLLLTVLSGQDLTSTVYVYASKNSAGVILFTGLILSLVYGFKKGKHFKNILFMSFIAILLVTIFLLKNRAMIVCIPVMLMIYVLYYPFSKRIKFLVILVSISMILLLSNEKIYDVVINQILFNNKSHTFEEASTGRLEQWMILGENLKGNVFLGDGRTEQESLILTALIQFGCFVGSFIIIYAFWPIAYSLKQIRLYKTKEMFALLCISVVYFVDAVVEQLAPFGPGVRCFYLWMLFGFILSNDRLLEEDSFD